MMTRASAAIATVWRWITRDRSVSLPSETSNPSVAHYVGERGLSLLNKQETGGACSSESSPSGTVTTVVEAPLSYTEHELAPLYLCRHCEEARQDHIGIDVKCVFFSTRFDEMTCATCNAILLVDDAYKRSDTDQPTCLVCAPRGVLDDVLAYYYKDKGL